MSNIIGSVLPPNLEKKTSSGCVVICLPPAGVADEAAILAAFVAAGYTTPSGVAPTGFINPEIANLNIGHTAYDAEGNVKKVDAPYIDRDGIEAINAGTTWCPKDQQLFDEDCDGFPGNTSAGVGTITNPTGGNAAFRICACLIDLDTDDADPTVNIEGGKGEGEGEG